ncbi:unnamed protein product [Protopolystoma xenopodis]|uniref:Uncharacterized protein n=1 Tax=Protopolystoma xenopodis TaxID=117903 RepID=A0A3S4ZP12_9PLAT|nr:unnamed protein product [Protopolystoma xenopodis]
MHPLEPPECSTRRSGQALWVPVIFLTSTSDPVLGSQCDPLSDERFYIPPYPTTTATTTTSRIWRHTAASVHNIDEIKVQSSLNDETLLQASLNTIPQQKTKSTDKSKKM